MTMISIGSIITRFDYTFLSSSLNSSIRFFKNHLKICTGNFSLKLVEPIRKKYAQTWICQNQIKNIFQIKIVQFKLEIVSSHLEYVN